MQVKVNVMLIDDEPLALAQLEQMLKQAGSVHIVGSFTDPLEGLAGALIVQRRRKLG